MIALRTLVLALFTVVSANALAASCDGFVDVDSANTTYCSAVSYVKDRGVTLGCTDSTHYCPNDYVTRQQMALFLQRMGRADPTNVLAAHTTAIGGGTDNTGGVYDTVGGGYNNTATSIFSTVGGGEANAASSSGGGDTVGGGVGNSASGGYSTVGGGNANAASGYGSTVVGGQANQATGAYSVAAGNFAYANADDCAAFSFWNQGKAFGMTCFGTAGSVRFAADHGLSIDYGVEQSGGGGSRYVYFGDFTPGVTIGTWTTAYLSDGGTWTNASDRNLKTDFVPADAQAILDTVAAMPMDTWRYKSEVGQRHIGPMAQDFYAAFGLGPDDKHITTVDEGGVALAAIQGLNAKLGQQLQERDAEIAALKTRLDRLEARSR